MLNCITTQQLNNSGIDRYLSVTTRDEVREIPGGGFGGGLGRGEREEVAYEIDD
jgi:hypothetical protein